MTTFWTPWGRKRWLKLPFGVSVAPELYQRKQHELLVDLKGIEPIADNILIVGCGDTEEGSSSEDSSEETGTSHGGVTHSSQTSCTPHRAEQGQAYSRSGRLIKPRDRLNL